MPSILLLLFAGILAGPVTGWLDPDAVFGDLLLPFVSLSVAIILFEGGLSLRVVELDEIGRPVRNLVTIGVLVTWIIATAAAVLLLEMTLTVATLLGAVLVVTGPTVILPLLRQLRPKGQVGKVLKWEGILVDPIGVILAVLVFEAILAGGSLALPQALALTVTKALAAGALFGLLGAFATYQLLKRHWVPDHLDNPVTLGIVVGVFTLCELVQAEAGLVGATVMGVALANQEDIAKRHIVEFKENLRVLLISFLFIVLAARLDPAALSTLSWRSIAFLVVLIVVGRPLAVLASTLGTDTRPSERAFLAALAPRGIVAAAISSVFALELAEAGIPGGEQLVPITFLVIIGTVLVYGLGAAPVARWLGVGDTDPQGALVVGAHGWARDFGAELQAAGIPVLMVDTNRRHLHRARDRGLRTFEGSLLTENALEDLDLGGIGNLIALTPNDEVNALTTINLRELFDSAHSYQLAPARAEREGPESVPPDIRARFLFAAEATAPEIAQRCREGWRVTTTSVPADAGVGNADLDREDRIPLAVVDAEGTLTLATIESVLDLEPGDRLIQLLAPDARELPENGNERSNPG